METDEQERRPCPVCGGEGKPAPGYESVDLDRCIDCGLIFLGRPVAATRGKYESDEYTDDHADFFEEDRAFTHIAAQRIKWLSRWTSSGALLELGPGRGHFLAAAQASGFEPLGVEASPGLAEAIVADFGVPVECGYLDEVDLPSRHFDAICMFHVLEHVEDPVDTLSRARDLLQDDGLLAVEVPNVASAMAERRGDQWAAVQPKELHISLFTVATLRDAADRAGLEIVEVDTVSPWHYLSPTRRLRPRALMGYGFRAAKLRSLGSTDPSGFDYLRIVARPGR